MKKYFCQNLQIKYFAITRQPNNLKDETCLFQAVQKELQKVKSERSVVEEKEKEENKEAGVQVERQVRAITYK